jgi:hypothetical protein
LFNTNYTHSGQQPQADAAGCQGFSKVAPESSASVILSAAKDPATLTDALLSEAEMLHFVQHDRPADFEKALSGLPRDSQGFSRVSQRDAAVRRGQL